MTPWFSSNVDGPGLHALVIGTSDYRFLPAPGHLADRGRVTLGLSKLDIAATRAFRFATWLKSGKYWHPSVQLKSIRLLLAPSVLEIQRVAGLQEVLQHPSVRRPDTATVWEELQEWQEECRGDTEGIAVLYAAGHGIQWGSPDDALVLLEDFSKDQNFVNQTLDVGRTLKGMNGIDLPRTQFYFADACAVEPEEYSQYEWAGQGVALAAKRNIPDVRSAPLYFAACPGTEALGKPGSGTYFALALVSCLDGEEPFGPPLAEPLSETDKFYRVSVASLVDNLKNRVQKISKKQEVTTGGRVRPGVFSAVKDNLVTVELRIDPEEAAKAMMAEILDSNETPKLTPPTPCDPVPIVQLVAGTYIVKLLNGNRPKLRTIAAIPPRFATPIKVQ
jgi:hypothetical protein